MHSEQNESNSYTPTVERIQCEKMEMKQETTAPEPKEIKYSNKTNNKYVQTKQHIHEFFVKFHSMRKSVVDGLQAVMLLFGAFLYVYVVFLYMSFEFDVVFGSFLLLFEANTTQHHVVCYNCLS